VCEPWNLQLIHQNIGYTAITTGELWNKHPEKSLGLRAAWVDKNPKAAMALLLAVMEAQQWSEKMENREEVAAAGGLDALLELAPTVILKRGGDGAVLYDDGEIVDVPGVPVDVVNGLGAGDAFGAALGYGEVQRDLPEMVQECGHLEIAYVGGRQSELLPDRRCQGRHPLGVARRHQPSELGSHRQRFDRLTVRAGGVVQTFERIPGGEQRRGEEQRSPDTHAAVTVDAAVADRHQHARRGNRQPGQPAPGREGRTEPEQGARADVDQQLRRRGCRTAPPSCPRWRG